MAYKKGIQTKENIIENARTLFYVYGLKEVSAACICKRSDVKLGTLTYYFKRKHDFIVYIYNDYMERINKYIEKNTTSLNPVQFHMYMIMMYYFNIYRDNNTVKFHEEVLLNTSMYNVLFSQKELFRPFIEHSSINKMCTELVILADNAVRRELNLAFISSSVKDVDEIKKLVNNIYTITAKLFNFDQNLLEKYIEEGYQFLINHIDIKIGLLR